MEKSDKIYVAGHQGLVGSALVRKLKADGFTNLVLKSRAQLDLTNQDQVSTFFEREKPDVVVLAAAKVGGIHANDTYPGDFIYQNLSIQNNVVHSSYLNGVKRLVFLGSSCIYPKECPQPMKESSLLTGSLEPTNRPYALAKIAGIEMCSAYNRQYGTRYAALMPTNLYGPGDNYHPENSHVIPGLMHKIHHAKMAGLSQVSLWGTGKPKREFLYVDDLADACFHIMNLSDDSFGDLLSTGTWPLVNVGTGQDLSILELAQLIAKVIGVQCNFVFDSDKPDGTMKKCLDVSLINQLGWSAKVTLEEGLKLTYKAYLKTQDKESALSVVS